MEIISFILLGVLGLAIVTISVFFVLIISKNMKNGRKFRRDLAQRLNQLRMTKLLTALGLDFDIYLHQVPVHKITQSMSKCESCVTTSACDEKLSQPAIQQTDIEFCPNQESFIEFSELTGKAA
jgi:hypothetical protein